MALVPRLALTFVLSILGFLLLWDFGFVHWRTVIVGSLLTLPLACTPVMQFLQRVLRTNATGLAMYAIVSAVFFKVPQISNLCWEMQHNLQHGVGFAVYLILVLLFFFSYWMMLLNLCKFNLVPVLKAVCIIVIGFMIQSTGLELFWQDHLADYAWSYYPFRAVVLVSTILYFWSWLLLLRPDEMVDPAYKENKLFRKLIANAKRYFRVAKANGSLPAAPKPRPPEVEYISQVMRHPYTRHILQPVVFAFAAINLACFFVHHHKCGWIVRKLNDLANAWAKPVAWIGAGLCLAFASLYLAGNQISHIVQPWYGVLGFNLLAPAALCLWMAVHAYLRIGAPREPGDFAHPTGSILSLLVTLSVIGEILWLAPHLPLFSELFSYRLYTIWAVFHLGFMLIAAGTWIDLTQRLWADWPVRTVSVGVLVLSVAIFNVASQIDADGDEFGNKLWTATAARGEEPLDDSLSWYRQVWDRIEAIKKKGDGPVIIVSASGGGSRAALFTSQVLEGLRHEPFNIQKPIDGKPVDVSEHKWADRILFISSVSGGSLATADFSFAPASRHEPRNELVNSLRSELGWRFQREFDRIKTYYDSENLEKLQKPRFADLFSEADFPRSDADIRTIFRSGFADDMCTDFMAPVLRGVLSMRVERGHSLSRFWQGHFNWLNPYDDAPYHNLLFDSKKRPLIVLNSTDAKFGSRVMLGFPQMPRRISTMHRVRKAESLSLSVESELKLADHELKKGDKGIPEVVKEKKIARRHTVRLSSEFRYTIDMKVKNPPAKGADLAVAKLDPYLFLAQPETDADGKIKPDTLKVLAQDDDGGGFPNARIANFKPPQNGEYTLFASSFKPGSGEYSLTVTQNGPKDATALVFDPNVRYGQSSSDFAPNYKLTLANAVRASANFPFGFPSCFVERKMKRIDFAANDALRRLLAADDNPQALFETLPDELNLLGFNESARLSKAELEFKLDDKQLRNREEIFAEIRNRILGDASPKVNYSPTRLNLIVAELIAMTTDTHVQKERREAARKIIEKLEAVVSAGIDIENVHLLDGGVNDNTGIPTLHDILIHLDFVSRHTDNLVEDAERSHATKIMDYLRKHGVIFLEIDSGQRATQADLSELQKPIAALENVSETRASEARRVILREMNRKLFPHEEYDKVNLLSRILQLSIDPSAEGPIDLPWMLPLTIMCNLGNDDDAVTAWSLGPRHKARVMAAYFCELQKFRKDTTKRVPAWIDARKKALEAPTVLEPDVSKSLQSIQEDLVKMAVFRIDQKNRVVAKKKNDAGR